PLAHVFGKVLEMAQLQVGFRSVVDGRIDKLFENLTAVRPTFMCAVPRVFEKLHSRMVATVFAGGGMRAHFFDWALGVGLRTSALIQRGKRPRGLLALQHALAQRLVFKKIQARMGGGIRFLVSGSAPLSREIAEFFHAGGVLICE